MKLVDIEPYKGKVIASHTYCGVNKLIEVDALEEISEQEIVKPILGKIRAEIENHCGLAMENHCKYCSYCNCLMGVREILELIDKYKTESEEE